MGASYLRPFKHLNLNFATINTNIYLPNKEKTQYVIVEIKIWGTNI